MTKPVPLKPVDQEWRWQYDGLCRTTSPELFFHPERERDPTRWRRDDRSEERRVGKECLL